MQWLSFFESDFSSGSKKIETEHPPAFSAGTPKKNGCNIVSYLL